MTALAALVADLQARGVTLEPRGEKLAIRPVSRLTREELEALRAHKPEVLRLLAPQPALTLDPATLREVLGPRPDPAALAALEAEVRDAIAQYQVEVATGVLGRGVLMVRGRPLADYLGLDTVARLLGARPGRGPR